MSALLDALKRKYRSPADALRAIGLPVSLLGNNNAPGMASDMAFGNVELAEGRGVTYAYDSINSLKVPAVPAASLGEGRVARPMKARRFGRDEELDREEMKELIDDPDSDFGDILAAIVEQAPDDRMEEVHEAMRELSMDARGPRSWARDRMERRRLGRDARRRLGRDDPAPFPGRPRTGGGMDPMEDRRAHDMALDADPRSEFEHMFGADAARIERIG